MSFRAHLIEKMQYLIAVYYQLGKDVAYDFKAF